LFDPSIDGLWGWDGVKSGIAFNGVKAQGIFPQKFCRLCTFGIKITHPSLKRPNRAAKKKCHNNIIARELFLIKRRDIS
jgi:hypothetical protein